MRSARCTLVGLLLVGLVQVGATTAAVAPPAGAVTPVSTAAPFTPRTGVIFNNPDGTTAQRQNILDYIARTVDSAPRGSMIRIAVYSFFDQVITDKLIAAKKRGVGVQLLVDGHTTTPQITQLSKAVGHNVKAKSFFKTCQFGCMSSDPASVMHAKIFLFSTAGKAKKVTMIGSGNPNPLGHDNGWNNQYTVVGNDALYRSSLKYFNDMVKDKTNTNYYRTTESGPYKLYFFPRAGWTAKTDTMYNVLRGVRCATVVPGTTTQRRTVVRVSMFLWTARRLAIAQQLWRLHDQGCDVQVIYPSNTVERPVVAALLKPSARYGQIKLYDTSRDRDGDGIFESYVHSKYVTVDGAYNDNPAAAAVWAGSANFGGTGLREGNEVTLKISGRSITSQYEADFDLIRSISKPITVVPPVKSTSGEHRDGELVVPDDYGN